MDLQPVFAPTGVVGRQVANLLYKEQLAFKLSRTAFPFIRMATTTAVYLAIGFLPCTGTGLRHWQSADCREERSCVGTGGA